MRLASHPPDACSLANEACPDKARRPDGGAEEIRTPDLRRAKAALSQLSYGPSRVPLEYAMALGGTPRASSTVGQMVGHSGLEPETSVLSGLRSNHLS